MKWSLMEGETNGMLPELRDLDMPQMAQTVRMYSKEALPILSIEVWRDESHSINK